MSASAISPPPPENRLLLPLPTEDFELEFRVVARGGTRRGIRLERAFWLSLKQMAESRKCTIGMLVDEIAESHAENGNLTSAIRVACIRALGHENLNLRRLASIRTVNAILLACPSPAFALASTKKIVTFNAPFQQLVKRQLPTAFDGDTRQDLKLALDLNVADIFARLDTNGDVAVASGFVIGAGERRYRGQLNVVRAPVLDLELLMAFVFNG
ncbi:ribbon-helix-helix domain-containing protein [Mesorhizobium sp. B2-3-13]|uniref:ribbon-helix-helix domain-containing protein n=1 Tax=Mesorhizobium sp. B2-3-13 TaxID=2589951 RepID=UPI00112E942B|nr:ribbon-helix-helix domain-containing protein [Mesorhizobium sp. B2-3-13]TPL73991.1 ribbon-helix-helix domain-containing protein [Mesorhizobium sp. B2-3-13]